MSFLTLLRRVAMTLLFILLPAASGWACTPVFVRGQASTLRLNVGQLTVPAGQSAVRGSDATDGLSN